MQSLHRAAKRSNLTRQAALALASLIAWGCASSSGNRPAPVETRDESGFTITEKVRVGFGVRADFESAVALLKRGEYERGIALLREVTEAALQLLSVVDGEPTVPDPTELPDGEK